MIFFISITVICWLISSGIIIECEACEDSIYGINYDKINYNGIVFGCLFLSMVPSGLRILRIKRLQLQQA
jgi:hypothetical protein